MEIRTLVIDFGVYFDFSEDSPLTILLREKNVKHGVLDDKLSNIKFLSPAKVSKMSFVFYSAPPLTRQSIRMLCDKAAQRRCFYIRQQFIGEHYVKDNCIDHDSWNGRYEKRLLH